MKKKSRQKLFGRGVVCLAVLLISFLCLGNSLTSAASGKKEKTQSKRVVKVGFLETTGLCEKDEYGNYTGLTVDYLNEIAKYTNWEYEFVPTTGETFMQDMAAGKFEVLGGTYYAKELESLFAYPKYSMGSSRAALLCLKDNNKIKSYELSTLNGKTIGVFDKAEEKIRRLKDYLKINGLNCKLKYYGTKDLSRKGDLYSFLEDKEVDLLMGNELENNKNFRLAASFDAQPYYIVTNTGNKEILDGLNMAMEKILDADPEFGEEHYEKNFKGLKSISSVYLSQEERKYIKKKKTVSVVVVSERHPFYCEVGKEDHHDGIIPDILEKVSEFSGLKYTYMTADTYEEAIELVQNKKADILGCFLDTEKNAKQENFILSSAYIKLNNIVLRNKAVNYPSGGLKAGILAGRSLPDGIKAREVITYTDSKELITALNRGEVDFIYGLASSLEQEMQNHRYANVVPVTGVNNDMGVSFALPSPADIHLLTILNKSINSISEEDKSTILNRNLVSLGSSLSLKDYIYANPIISVGMLSTIVLAVAAGLILVLRSKMRNKLMQSELEKAEAKSRAKSEFLSQMSHEIRTPMNAITGLTDLVRMEEKLPKGVEEKLQKIHASSQYMLALINDILDMSKIENGKMTIETEEFSLAELLDGLHEMMEEQAREKQLDLKFIKEFEHEWVMGDSIRLRQVITNLLSNALKFTKPGGSVTLTVREERTEDRTAEYFFSIKDTGVGIAPELQSQIFEAFEQLGASSTKSEGTGLGLPISASIVHAMGGQLKVNSQIGKGAEFFFLIRLPLGKDKDQKKEDVSVLPDFQGIRILLAEDNDLNAEIVQELLRMEGAETERVFDGQEAVERFLASEDGWYQIILMDIKMPRKNGYEAAVEIRKSSHANAQSIPIIAMTANSFKEDMEAAFEAGMNGFVPKPVDIQYLNRVLKQNLH